MSVETIEDVRSHWHYCRNLLIACNQALGREPYAPFDQLPGAIKEATEAAEAADDEAAPGTDGKNVVPNHVVFGYAAGSYGVSGGKDTPAHVQAMAEELMRWRRHGAGYGAEKMAEYTDTIARQAGIIHDCKIAIGMAPGRPNNDLPGYIREAMDGWEAIKLAPTRAQLERIVRDSGMSKWWAKQVHDVLNRAGFVSPALSPERPAPGWYWTRLRNIDGLLDYPEPRYIRPDTDLANLVILDAIQPPKVESKDEKTSS